MADTSEKKLLFVNASLTEGGSERAMALVANQFADMGYEVTMATVRPKPDTYALNPKISRVAFRYSSDKKPVVLVSRLKQIRKLARSVDPDYVISFMWDINAMTLVALVGTRFKTIVSERALPGNANRGFMCKVTEQVLYGLAYRIVYQTEQARSYCPKAWKKRSRVIPNIVQKPQMKPFSGQRGNRIVSVGRLTRQKNHEMLVKAFASFSEKVKGYTLEIYGEGPLLDKLQRQAEELGVSGSVRFKGFVDNVTEVINDARMFVLSSDFEGISNAMTEAMAQGLPVLCTDCPVGGAALIIEDGVNGVLTSVGDASEMTRHMIELATDDELTSKLSANAVRIADDFSPTKIAKLWEALFE